MLCFFSIVKFYKMWYKELRIKSVKESEIIYGYNKREYDV